MCVCYFRPAALSAQQVSVSVRVRPLLLERVTPHQLPVAQMMDLTPLLLGRDTLLKLHRRLRDSQPLQHKTRLHTRADRIKTTSPSQSFPSVRRSEPSKTGWWSPGNKNIELALKSGLPIIKVTMWQCVTSVCVCVSPEEISLCTAPAEPRPPPGSPRQCLKHTINTQYYDTNSRSFTINTNTTWNRTDSRFKWSLLWFTVWLCQKQGYYS